MAGQAKHSTRVVLQAAPSASAGMRQHAPESIAIANALRICMDFLGDDLGLRTGAAADAGGRSPAYTFFMGTTVWDAWQAATEGQDGHVRLSSPEGRRRLVEAIRAARAKEAEAGALIEEALVVGW